MLGVVQTDLTIGKAYYRVTYADRNLTMPGVQPLIYLGANVFDNDPDNETIYYFQDAGEWHRYGNALELPEELADKTGVISERNRNEIHELEEVIQLPGDSLEHSQLRTE